MRLNSTTFCLTLAILALSIVLLPATAQAPTAFSFTLQKSSLADCWYFGVSFSATAGQPFTIQWSEGPSAAGPVSVNFYIAPVAAVQQVWLCDNGPVNLYWNDGAYGTPNWAPPATGGYAALIVNYSKYSVSGMISITTANATVSATPIGPTTVRRVMPVPLFARG